VKLVDIPAILASSSGSKNVKNEECPVKVEPLKVKSSFKTKRVPVKSLSMTQPPISAIKKILEKVPTTS
jgi:hypothetical protein